MPCIYTELERLDSGGDPEAVEIRVQFTAICTARASAATRVDPAWGAEYEFTIGEVDFELPRGAAAPAPLTEAERAEVAMWFAGKGSEKAHEAAIDAEQGSDDRADYDYDTWRDRQMEDRFEPAALRRAA